ncbi:site-2 protease family protein [Streptomyces iakyrus]|uniref:site-2 protease family protein n=1 Tax=Streptomyces iakyrus TaxID=68219 RepID=UPI0005270E58|nr:site-2 protease family protein [Streptomyces iakyrus]
MDESGGRGQPRSGNDESAEPHEGLPPRATDPAPADEQPADEHGPASARPARGPEPAVPAAPAATPGNDSAPPRPTAADAAPDPRTADPAPAGADAPAPAAGAGDEAPEAGPDAAPARAAAETPRPTPAPAGGEDDGSPETGPRPDRAPAASPYTAPARAEGAGDDAPEARPHRDGPHTAPARAEGRSDGSPQTGTHPDRTHADGPRAVAGDAGVASAPSAPAQGDGGSSPEAGAYPDRAHVDGPRAVAGDAGVASPSSAPAQGAGGGSPEADAHPDRAYAGDQHAAPAAGRPQADRHAAPAAGRPQADRHAAPAAGRPAADPLRKAPAPGHAPDAGDAHRREQPSAPGPLPGHPSHRPDTPVHAHGDRPLAHSADGKGPAPQRPEPRGGLLMGRPFGVPVYVAPSWFLVAALITWVFGGQLERVLPELGAARYLVSLFFAVAFYASVLVHELAHTVAALRFKLPVRRIQLQFFGGVSEIEKEAETPGREFVLAFVGPLLSLVLAGAFYAAAQTVEPGTVPGVLLAGLMISNLIVAAFNLLPGLPLDGGRMLRAVVWKITGKPMTGTVAAAWVGRALAVSVLIGLPLLTQSGALGTDAADNVGMDTVLDALLAAILAAIIWTGAGNSLRMARLREHLPELRARALTRRAVPVESDTPLSEALRRANAAGARALVVVDADGQPLSLVREAAIVGVPEHRRPWVAVSGLAQDLTDGMRVSAELSGEELLDALRATPATEYLVVEETGEIYGVLSAADVERAFVKAMARPS